MKTLRVSQIKVSLSKIFKALALFQVVFLALFSLSISYPTKVDAHGGMTSPQSRIHKCRFDGNVENHTDPACLAAIDFGGKQAIYDWTALRQENADSAHQSIIPDGQLCGGGNPLFKGMNVLRNDWRRDTIKADANGMFQFIYRGTAPHSTKDWIFYVTKQSWQPGTPLRWDNIEEFCRLGDVPITQNNQGKDIYRLNCPLPNRSGPHIIYNIWQRSDSKEAFYSCSDVTFEGGPITPPAAVNEICISCLMDLLMN